MTQFLHWQFCGYLTSQLFHVHCILSTKWDVNATAAGSCAFLVFRGSLPHHTCLQLSKVCTERSSYYSVSDQHT